MISLIERSEVSEIGTETLDERSESSVIVESRDHYLPFMSSRSRIPCRLTPGWVR